jgi:hypothetical protein
MMRLTLIKIVRGALLLGGLAMFVTSCSTPVAKFSADRDTYNGGDTVRLKNESTGADGFEWFLNDQAIGNSHELVYVLDKKAKGPLVFKLKANNGEKSSAVASKTVMATTPLGTVTAWSTFPGVEVIQVSDDKEEPAGLTAAGFTDNPGCGSEGAITLVLTPGTYTIDGASAITRSRRVVEVQDNDCVSLKMH